MWKAEMGLKIKKYGPNWSCFQAKLLIFEDIHALMFVIKHKKLLVYFHKITSLLYNINIKLLFTLVKAHIFV